MTDHKQPTQPPKVGDRVTVTEDRYNGLSGVVVAVEGDVAIVNLRVRVGVSGLRVDETEFVPCGAPRCRRYSPCRACIASGRAPAK